MEIGLSSPPETIFDASVTELNLGDVSFYDLAEALHDRPDFSLLDSQGSHGGLGAFSMFAFQPFAKIVVWQDTVTVTDHGGERISRGDPFRALNEYLARYRMRPCDQAARLPFGGGAVGYFSYELGRQIEVLPAQSHDDVCLPDAYLCVYNFAVVLHHESGRVFLSHLDSGDTHVGPSRESIMAALSAARPGTYGVREASDAEEPSREDFHADLTPAAYRDAIARIKEYIVAGDVYQVNMTQRFSADIGETAPWDIFKHLAATNPAPCAAYLNCDGHVVVSSSPERFLLVRNRYVETRPIKGTTRRGATAAEDQRNSRALFQSAKNRAELAMIVDLLRNDLGRVCVPGSVKVDTGPRVETYASVHHLVATIVGELDTGVTVMDLLKATFPGGSITGAPKIRAMEIIDELEPVTRGVYTGSIGYLTFDNRADLNIAIRTVVIKDRIAYVQAGGGIVADSIEEDEYQESLLKASKLLRAVSVVSARDRAAVHAPR